MTTRSSNFSAFERSAFNRCLASALLSLSLATVAQATPEKAAKFYEDALQRFEKGDLNGATIQLKNTIQQDQKMLAAHLLLGKVLLKSGELKGAEAALEEALKQGVSRSEVMLPLAQLYMLLGERKKLIDEISISGVPVAQHPELLSLRGTAYALSGNLPLASKSFADARAIDPSSAAPLIAEAPLLLRLGEREKARAAAAKAVELAPKSAAAWYVQGTTLQALQDAKGALAAQDRALSIDEKHVDARVARASLLIGQNREADAEKDLAQLQSWNLPDPRASYMRALLASRKGNAAAAKAAYGEAVGMIDALPPGLLAGNEPLLMAGALSHRALNNLEKARGYLENLLALNSRHLPAQVLLASVMVDMKDYARALPVLEAANRAAPDNAQVLYLLGAVNMERKRYLQASEFFEKAVAGSGGATSAVRELGFSQLGMGQDKAGQTNLEKAFAANPGDPRSGIELTMIYARQGQMAKALQTAQTIVDKDPENLTMLNFLGNVKGRSGDKRGAREAFQKVLTKEPSFRPAAINLSWLDMEEKRFDDARRRLNKMLDAQKDDADVMFQLGVLELRADRPAEAMKQWERANEVARNDPRAGMAMFNQLMSQKEHEKALAIIKPLAAKHADKLPVQLALANAFMAVGDSNNARLALQDAARTANYDADKLVRIGRLQLLNGTVDGAAYTVQKALQASPDDLNALILQVEVQGRRGDNAKVDSALKALSNKYPGHVATVLTSAHVAMSRGKFAAAADGYRAVMEKAPSSGTALMLVQAQIAMGEADKALAFLEDWAKKQPNDKLMLKALAEVQMQAGKNDAARKSYSQILAADPNDAASLGSYALLLQRLGDPTAKDVAEKALKLTPNNPELMDVLGWVLTQQGKLDAGIRYLRDARLRNPSNGDIRYHLAFALAKAGRKAEAKEELAAAPQANPDVQRLKKELGL